MTNLIKLFLFLAFSISLVNCGGFKKVDTRKTPVNAMERARKNVEEGRGVTLGGLARGGGRTTYEFSTSNPMWRASLEILDFFEILLWDHEIRIQLEKLCRIMQKQTHDKINNLEKTIDRIEKIMLTSAGVLITGMASVIIVLITR